MPGRDSFYIRFVYLNIADTRLFFAGIDSKLITYADRPVQKRARDNRAEAFDGKYTIYIEAGFPVLGGLRHLVRPFLYFIAKFGNTLSAYSVRFHDFGVLQRRIGQLFANILNGKFTQFFIYCINFR